MSSEKKVSYKILDEFMGNGTKTTEFYKDKIKGATLFNHYIESGDTIEIKENAGGHHILVLVSGKANFIMEGAMYHFSVRTIFVPGLEQNLEIEAVMDSQILEVFWKMNEKDYEEMKNYSNPVFPKIQLYKDSIQYHDHAKSYKTINRICIEQLNIPRFAMGSVESYGPDSVAQHPHPTIDQFFFSFPENDMKCMIDDYSVPMKGNTLLHIPLGSNHGVEVEEGKRMHYMWIDFLLVPEAVNELKKGHIKTGKMRDFKKEGY